MPKPLGGEQGSGMHTHVSLFKDGKNAFADEHDPYGLSDVARSFIAGVLTHANEFTAITNQWINSYKRLVPGHEAPVHVSWARNNSSALVRVPVVKAGRLDSTRIEYRAPDSAANPYLAFAVILAAGLAGIERGYVLGEEATGNLFELDAHEREARGVRVLPSNLNDAVDDLEGSELVRSTLGDHIVEWFIRNKREEWSAYKGEISAFELNRYLPRL